MSHAHDFSGTVILVTNDGMGQGPVELRHKLMGVYLSMLLEIAPLPAALCFYGEGVKLVLEGSPVLARLEKLERQGVLLISCATCLNYFDLAEKVAVGVMGGMHEIVAAQCEATKVITL